MLLQLPTITLLTFFFLCILTHKDLIPLSAVKYSTLRIYHIWASLVVQWLRIPLPMQGIQIQALVWKDPTCCGAAKPVHHNS